MGILDWPYYFFEVTGNTIESVFHIASNISRAPFDLFSNRKQRQRKRGLFHRLRQRLRGNPIRTPAKKGITRRPVSPNAELSKNNKLGSPAHAAPTEKIQKLESELSRLRAEIAKILDDGKLGQSTPKKSDPEPEEPMTEAVIPPPPPLPPVIIVEKPSAPKKEEYGPNSTLTGSDDKNARGQSVPLNEILTRGASLKKAQVQRSPGGTPIYSKKDNKNNSQEFIAQALKKKFLNVRGSPKSPLAPIDTNRDDWEEQEI